MVNPVNRLVFIMKGCPPDLKCAQKDIYIYD